MKIIWELQTATVRDVYEALLRRRKIAYTTVMTMMNILEEKGYLKKQRRGQGPCLPPRPGQGQSHPGDGAGFCPARLQRLGPAAAGATGEGSPAFGKRSGRNHPADQGGEMSAPLWFQNLVVYSLQVALMAAAGLLLPRLLRLRRPRVLYHYGRHCWRCACCFLWCSPGAISRWRAAPPRPAASCSSPR